MRILFFISVQGHGRGGHFHSLDHISRKLGAQHEVGIITIGIPRSRLIMNSPFFVAHIDFRGYNILSLWERLRNITNSFKPDIYHCFDNNSYNLIRLFYCSRNNKIVLTKCGGPNFSRFPYVKNLVTFSVENYDWFKGNMKYKLSNIYFLPNRVNPVQLKEDFQPFKKDHDSFTFIRICRIGYKYQKSIKDSMRLIARLHSFGLTNSKLLIIGVISDNVLFNEIASNELVSEGHVILLTDDVYTNEASKMLYLADAVVGTGRGLMEASSLGKPVLTINQNDEIPVLIDESTFEEAFRTNFSERNQFVKFDKGMNLEKIRRLVNDKDYYCRIGKYSKMLFDRYFCLDEALIKYNDVYESAQKSQPDIFPDILLICQSWINYFRNNFMKNR